MTAEGRTKSGFFDEFLENRILQAGITCDVPSEAQRGSALWHEAAIRNGRSAIRGKADSTCSLRAFQL
jgi:hypothetical protein